ncbi:hypothetical protein LIPSTDRAFT_74713 [Lipomyces starkeyi NRRL Y-11557]|uniref:Uncharacterized protein n=1 Tax=Lipomyces starkeyi NRRL Y-11557 TaxID=675824 RepID=A0A1E3PYK2_LIPST|nr:hypothetical protein LIPSTDRAFT_74713 [Lipomyces starkeyi NRRL Y-11557]
MTVLQNKTPHYQLATVSHHRPISIYSPPLITASSVVSLYFSGGDYIVSGVLPIHYGYVAH